MQLIKYTNESLWEAIYKVAPYFADVRAAGTHLSITIALEKCAVDLFVQGDIEGRNLVQAAATIQQALLDLNENGVFNYSK